ncbi:MAG TPA: DUF72 domain-containing protein [Xanthobacteraceae bacterium]|jgi:uncharacterized protein YecE (DUF72 family)
MTRIWIGTSGWTYDGWRGLFYPKTLAKKDWLAWYGNRFPSAEINGSFYRTPSLAAVRSWRDQTPADFLFAWKASKFITHWKRLNETTCANSIELMETRLEQLSPKVGAVLFQLPARFTKNCERLASFLAMLPPRYRYAFEFRHKSWYDREVFALLRAHGVALCLSDHHDAPAPWEVTARHVYVRGHGPGGRYRDHYSDRTLRAWARHIVRWRQQRRTVFVYFDNDHKSAAPADARRLMQLVKLAPRSARELTPVDARRARGERARARAGSRRSR